MDIQFKELIKRRNRLTKLRAQGVELVFPKSHKLMGASLVLFGAVTFPFPTGSLFFIPIGLTLMRNSKLNKPWPRFN